MQAYIMTCNDKRVVTVCLIWCVRMLAAHNVMITDCSVADIDFGRVLGDVFF